jgi:hypothetical protein
MESKPTERKGERKGKGKKGTEQKHAENSQRSMSISKNVCDDGEKERKKTIDLCKGRMTTGGNTQTPEQRRVLRSQRKRRKSLELRGTEEPSVRGYGATTANPRRVMRAVHSLGGSSGAGAGAGGGEEERREGEEEERRRRYPRHGRFETR